MLSLARVRLNRSGQASSGLSSNGGKHGERGQRYRQGRGDQLGALGFAVKALDLWNAQYLADAIAHLRAIGRRDRR
jgi:TnpA family transposase